jgi:hypothetical protein
MVNLKDPAQLGSMSPEGDTGEMTWAKASNYQS